MLNINVPVLACLYFIGNYLNNLNLIIDNHEFAGILHAKAPLLVFVSHRVDAIDYNLETHAKHLN